MPLSATLIVVDFRPEPEFFMPCVTATLRSIATCLAYRHSHRRRRHLPHLPAPPTPPATSVSAISPLRSPERFRRRPICSTLPLCPCPLPTAHSHFIIPSRFICLVHRPSLFSDPLRLPFSSPPSLSLFPRSPFAIPTTKNNWKRS